MMLRTIQSFQEFRKSAGCQRMELASKSFLLGQVCKTLAEKSFDNYVTELQVAETFEYVQSLDLRLRFNEGFCLQRTSVLERLYQGVCLKKLALDFEGN